MKILCLEDKPHLTLDEKQSHCFSVNSFNENILKNKN